MTQRSDLEQWMLDADPALRWQVERDIVGAPPEVWEATRARVAAEGFGARLLALQDEDGQWDGGAYFPGHDFPEDAAEAHAEAAEAHADDSESDGPPAQPWTATTWTLNALREWGLDAAALAGTAELLDKNSRWEYDDLPYWGGEVDCCINGFTLANGGWLGADVRALVAWFPEHQLADGGWNCEWVEGSSRSSFHSTLNALGGILDYEMRTGDRSLVNARHKAEEYLLERRLTRRLSDGEIVGPWVSWFVFPFRWTHSALRGLDYFRTASLWDGKQPDPRLAEAVDIVRAKRQPDGTWLQDGVFPGKVWFEVDVPKGEPSKWLTFFGTRVLDWWDDAAQPRASAPTSSSIAD